MGETGLAAFRVGGTPGNKASKTEALGCGCGDQHAKMRWEMGPEKKAGTDKSRHVQQPQGQWKTSEGFEPGRDAMSGDFGQSSCHHVENQRRRNGSRGTS